MAEVIDSLVERRKRQILKAAAHVFSKEGFANANTDRIAKRARLGKGTIYRYFSSKRDLFLSVVDRGLNKMRDEILQEVRKRNGVLEKIESAIRTYLAFFEKNSNFIGILLHEQSNFRKKVVQKYFEYYYRNVDKIKEAFKLGMEQGIIKDIDLDSLISVYMGLLNGLIYMWQIEGRKYRLVEMAPIVVRVFFTGIVKDEGQRRRYDK